MVVAKRQERGKNHKNRTKEGPRTRVRTSGKTNTALLASPVYIGQAQGGEKKKKKKKKKPI